MCWLVPTRDRNKKSLLCKLPSFINAATASLVPLVISNCTGLPVFCCNTVALLETELPYATSDTLSLTRSQPRSLLSRPYWTELNRAFYLPVQAGFGSPRYEISEVVFLADDTVFIPRWRVHTQISYNVGDLSMVVPYERWADVNLGLYTGTAEISVTNDFCGCLPVRKTAVNRTVKKWPFGTKKHWPQRLT